MEKVVRVSLRLSAKNAEDLYIMQLSPGKRSAFLRSALRSYVASGFKNSVVSAPGPVPGPVKLEVSEPVAVPVAAPVPVPVPALDPVPVPDNERLSKLLSDW